jgi:hypothetical protein
VTGHSIPPTVEQLMLGRSIPSTAEQLMLVPSSGVVHGRQTERPLLDPLDERPVAASVAPLERPNEHEPLHRSATP